jgi:photosystem II stability/assembly factor-like uncharacterized protein
VAAHNNLLTHGWGFTEDDVWVPTLNGGIYRSTDRGKTWNKLTSPAPPGVFLSSFWGSSAMNIFLVGGNLGVVSSVMRTLDGGKNWLPKSDGITNLSTAGLAGVFGFGNEVYVCGTKAIYRSTDNGDNWMPETLPDAINNSMAYRVWNMWGPSPSDVYAVADGGIILHREAGGSWKTVVSPGDGSSCATQDSQTFFNITGTSGSNIYAVGGALLQGQPIVCRYNGQSWTSEAVANETKEIHGVAIRGTDVFIGAASGEIYRRGSGIWFPQNVHNVSPINDMFAAGLEMYAVGFYDTILHYY